ncbi:MAG: MBL fold metallo-hydrolase [Thermodesulfobacteriota bacterium]
MKNISLCILGGGREIGANSYLLRWGDYQILLDAGFNPAKIGYDALPHLDLIDNDGLDAIIITHAHLDHIGSLPYIVNHHFKIGAKIFMTEPTAALIPIMLMETVKALERESILRENQYFYHHYFDRSIVREYLQSYFEVRYIDVPFEVLPGISCQFFHAGHILGAVGVILRDKDTTIVYTGDFGTEGQEWIEGCHIPNGVKADCLIIEGTHGGDDESGNKAREEEITRLRNRIAERLNNGGHVLIPSFALGRTQEMLALLDKWMTEGSIPSETPVMIHSGITGSINEIYTRYDGRQGPHRRALGSICNIVNGYLPSGSFASTDSLSDRPTVFVFTSGMMARRTPSARLAEELIQDERNGIYFVGYVAPGDLGYELLNAKPGDKVCTDIHQNDWVEIRTPNIERFSLSAHAGFRDLLRVSKEYDPSLVLWVHGDEKALDRCAQELQRAGSEIQRAWAPANREEIWISRQGRKILLPLKSLRAVIVTVGTSLLTGYQKGKKKISKIHPTLDQLKEYVLKHLDNLPKLSAETHILWHKPLETQDVLYLICGDNPDVKICGQVLQEFYGTAHLVECIVVDGLRPEPESFENRGTINLVQELTRIIQAHSRNTVIHATGGFKGQIALATLLGILFHQPVTYLYEGFEKPVNLPPVPLDFDYSRIHSFREPFFQLVDARNTAGMPDILNQLPEDLLCCFQRNPDSPHFCLTALGRAILKSYLEKAQNQAKEIPIRRDGSSGKLWGMNNRQREAILNPAIALIIERISRFRDMIIEMVFFSQPVNPGAGLFNVSQEEKNYLELIEKTGSRLRYRIHHINSQPDIADYLDIMTVAGIAPTLRKWIGRLIFP